MDRRKQRQEEERRREEEMARLQQVALAESAVHASNLEADITGESNSTFRNLAKGYHENGTVPNENEQKTDQENEMVWHPYVVLISRII